MMLSMVGCVDREGGVGLGAILWMLFRGKHRDVLDPKTKGWLVAFRSVADTLIRALQKLP